MSVEMINGEHPSSYINLEIPSSGVFDPGVPTYEQVMRVQELLGVSQDQALRIMIRIATSDEG